MRSFSFLEPRVCDIGSNWCHLEWSSVRNPGVGTIEYLLQLQHISNVTREEETQQVIVFTRDSSPISYFHLYDKWNNIPHFSLYQNGNKWKRAL